MSRLMTLKEIAKQLDVPESSLRKYREIFSEFIPSVGSGRSRRYRADATEVLKDIRHLREELHMPWDAITGHLAEKYPIDATPKDAKPRAAQTSMRLDSEQVEIAHRQPPQQPAPDGNNYMKKFLAISEKQTMIVNAVALEMIRSVDLVREEAREDNRQLRESVYSLINSLAGSINTISKRELETLSEVRKQLDAMEKSLETFSKTGDLAVKTAQLQEYLRIAKQKLDQKEKTIEEYKKSFTVMKKENTDLRDFKARHIESAEERIREVKALKKTSPIKRIFGFKA